MQRRTGKIIERKISEGRIQEMGKMKERKKERKGGGERDEWRWGDQRE